jgi:anti-anti-sigma regulatory factor
VRQVSVEGAACLRDAAALAASLNEALEEGGAVVDLAEVESLDAAILQTLLAGHRSAVALGARLTLSGTSNPAFREALVRHGLVAADGASLTPEHDFWAGAPVRGDEA